MAATSITDEYGNIWDDQGYYIGVGADAGKFYYGGDWHYAPPLASLGGGGSTSGGTTYQWITSDGSDGMPAGTTYQLSSTGQRSNIKYPSGGSSSGGGGSSSGGGGSSSPTNVYINQNPGQLYTDRISDGSDGYPVGTIIQTNNVTGAETVKYKPPAPAKDPASLYNDLNGDGYDDQTGMPNGVTSFGGDLYFQGTRVHPDGSPYTAAELAAEAAADAPDAKSWNGQGPKGYGTYLLDGPGGSPGTYIGDPRAPSTAKTENNFTGSGMKLSVPQGSGGGGGGGYSIDPNIGARADAEMQVARMKADLEREFFYVQQAALNDPSNLQNQMKLQQINMQLQQLAQTEARYQAEHRRGLISDFRSAVTDTDPSALHAMLYAQGVPAGGNIVNRLDAGDTALSDQALSGAAAILRELRQSPTQQLPPWVPQVPGLPSGGAPSGGLPGTGGVPGAPGTGGTPTVPGLPSAPTGLNAQQKILLGQYNQGLDAERAKFLTQNAESNWVPDGKQGTIPYYKNTVTGARIPVSEWYSLMEDVRSAVGTPTRGDEFLNSLNPAESVWYGATPEAQGAGGNWVTYGGTFNGRGGLKDYGNQLYDMPWGPSLTNQVNTTPTVDPHTGGYTRPPTTGNLSGDQVQQGVDPALLPSTEPIPRVRLPMLAMGGLAGRAAITGDPQPGSNRPNPELTEWTPQGLRVTPLSQMPRQRAQALMRGLPRHYEGFDPYAATYNPYGSGGSSTGLYPTYTQPAPVAQPTYTAPATQPATTTAQPATTTTSTPTQPVTTPVQQPAQTTTAPAQTTTQPQQPVMTGLPTASGTFDITGLAPEEQALLDEARQVRESTPVPELGMSPYNSQWQLLTPSIREAYLKGIAAQKGIPVGDFAWEIDRAQAMMPGLSAGSYSVGY